MAGNYTTPGVYVEEISKLPPSIAQVETAVPAFIGYTQKAEKDGKNLIATGAKPTPVRISSMLDYEIYFGGAPEATEVIVNVNSNKEVQRVEISPQWYLYHSLQLFFGNGGGKCYIVSVGHYGESADEGKLKAGLAAIRKVDEPTLLVIPDSTLLDETGIMGVQQEMLKQCADLQDRFAILDIKHGNQDDYDVAEVNAFRNYIGINSLNYGAAYFPWLRSTLSAAFSYTKLKLTQGQADTSISLNDITSQSTLVGALDELQADRGLIDGLSLATQLANYQAIPKSGDKAELEQKLAGIVGLIDSFLGIDISIANADVQTDFQQQTAVNGPVDKLVGVLRSYDLQYEDVGGVVRVLAADPTFYATYTVTTNTGIYTSTAGAPEATVIPAVRPAFDDLFQQVIQFIEDFFSGIGLRATTTEEELLKQDPIYSQIATAVKNQGIVLPPSGAIAGIYAFVDDSRGVWKAPANVSLAMVKSPTVKITSEDQGELNVDPVAGKSVNAIRAFTGKGTLVWGARTLAGNDNEWRYVPVRRLFVMVEESVMKGTEPFVFEPNDRNTWMKVKAMIQNYLTGLWQQGALAGAKPEDAFYVSVGLGETMTSQDILEGRLIIEIGMAAVRPAEFIILRFSHKLQES